MNLGADSEKTIWPVAGGDFFEDGRGTEGVHGSGIAASVDQDIFMRPHVEVGAGEDVPRLVAVVEGSFDFAVAFNEQCSGLVAVRPLAEFRNLLDSRIRGTGNSDRGLHRCHDFASL